MKKKSMFRVGEYVEVYGSLIAKRNRAEGGEGGDEQRTRMRLLLP